MTANIVNLCCSATEVGNAEASYDVTTTFKQRSKIPEKIEWKISCSIVCQTLFKGCKMQRLLGSFSPIKESCKPFESKLEFIRGRMYELEQVLHFSVRR